MSQDALDTIYNCGIVGAGGAGFPAHIKFNAEAEIVIMNAAECEPLLHKDKQLLKTWPEECLNGLREVMKLVGARRGIVGIKEKYGYVFEALEPYMTSPLEFCRLGNFYPAGDEVTLVYEATGRVVAPGQIPLSAGCIVSNVETLLNIQKKEPVTTSFLSVVGEVESPMSLEVLIGSTCKDAISAAGPITCEDPVLLLGGPMMGALTEDLSTPITKTTGGILVLDRSHDLIQRYAQPRAAYEKIAKASCDQCNFCTELCPRYLLGHPIEPHKNMRNMGFATSNQDLIAGAEFCCECNLCSLYACPEDLDPKNISTNLKWAIKKKTEGRLSFEPGSVEAHSMAEFRKAPIPKLMRKLDLDRFKNEAPLKPGQIGSSEVFIPLSQHLGAPANPLLAKGEIFQRGQRIAVPPAGAMGACIHASLSGEVLAIENGIRIRG